MRCHLSVEKTNIREGNDILRLFLRFHGLIEISYGRVSSIHFPTFNGMLNLQFEQRGLVDQVGHTQCFDWHPRCFLPNCATACVCVDRVVGGGGGGIGNLYLTRWTMTYVGHPPPQRICLLTDPPFVDSCDVGGIYSWLIDTSISF